MEPYSLYIYSVIAGRERNGIIVARSKITNIIDLRRSDQPADHFLSIPLASKDLIESFNQFKTEVLKLKVSVSHVLVH